MSKRLPYPAVSNVSGNPSGPKWWRSLRERDDSPELVEELLREFPPGADVPDDTVSRRSFFRLMGASMALAGVAACRRPEEKILPYSKSPEEVIPGNALQFATAMPWGGTAIGLLVESHEGRPTKIEGNPKHPESGGGTGSFAQAAVLELYDPDRADQAYERGAARTAEAADKAIADLVSKYAPASGRGLAVLTEAHRSPTIQAALDKLKARLPEVQLFRFDPFAKENARVALTMLYGRPLEPVYDLARAKVLVSLDADLLCDDTSGVRNARAWAQARSPRDPGQMNRVYAIESRHSVTGAAADHRLRLQSRQITRVAEMLARGMGLRRQAGDWLPESIKVPPHVAKWLGAIARDLEKYKGDCLVVAGDNQPALVHGLVHAINAQLGNVGRTVRYVEAFSKGAEGPEQLTALGRGIEKKEITGVVILGGNPVFNGPADAKLGERLASLEDTIFLGHEANETAKAVKWLLPRAHFLEQWGDVRAADGTYSVVQPLIAPLYDGRSDAELLSILAGQPQKAYDLVRETARATFGEEDFERRWRRTLHDGLWAASELPAVEAGQPNTTHLDGMGAREYTGTGLEVTFHPDPHAWDGRFANNAWMQELPDPMWKRVWGNVALFSEKTMKDHGLREGDLINLVDKTRGAGCEAVVAHGIGQADDSIAVTIGQGRENVGRVGTGVGTRTATLRTARAWGTADGIAIMKRDGGVKVLQTQEHFQMEQRIEGGDNYMTRPAVVREADLVEFGKTPDFAKHMGIEMPHRMNIWGEPWKYEGHKWAMAIDLHTCIGCNACAVACQAENNIPVVGAENVAKSREMHWIRIDRYFEGKTDDDVHSVAQPMTCQQCENAPCEQVCPVGATTHSPEGLNDMAYNRCIGTKYCLNNCPFKVRRFNYFNYTKGVPSTKRLQYNPDVTVRSRGVMEKCTYCVQRINAAKIAAHRVGEDRVKDGAIVTACQQACPTHAITFGDLNDKTSEISRVAADPRGYKLLEEINVRPRGTYLARIKNLNPELA